LDAEVGQTEAGHSFSFVHSVSATQVRRVGLFHPFVRGVSLLA
jgi:hypothetical protein